MTVNPITLDGPDVNRQADTAVTNALRLVEAVRDVDKLRVGVFLADLDRESVEQMAVALAAMLPGDVYPPSAMAWLESSPQFWPMDTLVAECRRFDAGDRDTTARSAAAEVNRLAATSEARHVAARSRGCAA